MARYLSGKNEIESITGIDIKEPCSTIPKFSFYNRDVRELIDDIIKKHSIDTVIHTAFILPPIHDVNLMEDININGTLSVLDSCVSAGVKQMLYTSSANAYGFHADNDRPLTEESPLRGNDDVTYSKSKRIIEGIISEYEKNNPDLIFTILRPCFVVGPGFDNPLARFLKLKIVPLPIKTEPMQFVHEDDLIEIMNLLLAKRKRGVYNVTGDGVMSIPEMVKALGNVPRFLPYPLLYILNSAAWFLRLKSLSGIPSSYLKMIRYSWVTSGEKLKRETGYTYRYDTRKAFADFARCVKERRVRRTAPPQRPS